MAWQGILLFLFCFVFGSQAVTLPSDGNGKGFSLHASKPENAKRDFVREWVSVRQKWGGSVPESVVSTFSLADADGRVDVHPMGSDDIYIADVQIGEPPQTVKMALDTGSADLWIQSTDTSYRINKDGPWAPKYRPKDSKTSQTVSNSTWSVQYLDGTAAYGIVYRDTVRLGGYEVRNVPVESAQMITSQFEAATNMSGILGLAKSLPTSVEPATQSFMTLLRPLLDEHVFSVDLRKNATGRFDFGFINTAAAVDDMTWLDSDPNSRHWDVELDLTSWEGNGRTWWYYKFMATIDTGTTLMFLPDGLASMYWFDVPGMRSQPGLGNAYTFPCSGAKDLPDLMFKLPGTEHVITIPGPYLNYGPTESDPTFCWGGMQSSAGMEVTVIGDIMLKALVLGFDLERQRIGFANKKLD